MTESEKNLHNIIANLSAENHDLDSNNTFLIIVSAILALWASMATLIIIFK